MDPLSSSPSPEGRQGAASSGNLERCAMCWEDGGGVSRVEMTGSCSCPSSLTRDGGSGQAGCARIN